ncbi:MAG: hypothetical protein ACE14Q_05165, partial [Acidobacteriota bacterium]
MKKLLTTAFAIFVLMISCSKEPSKPKEEKEPVKSQTSTGSPLTLKEYEGKTPEFGGSFRRTLPSEPVTLNPVVAAD